MEKIENPTMLLMFVSRCVLSDGKSEGRVYYEVDESYKDAVLPSERPKERIFLAKKVSKYMGGSAGIVYRVEVPSNNPEQIYTATAEYVGMWPDQEQRAAWQVADQAAGQKIALMKAAKKAKKDDAVLDCLAPIREAYQRARGVQRSLILARAVQYITR